MPDKRYLVFTHIASHSLGGIKDMDESFNDTEAAVKYLKSDRNILRDMKGADFSIYDRIAGVKIDLKKFGL